MSLCNSDPAQRPLVTGRKVFDLAEMQSKTLTAAACPCSPVGILLSRMFFTPTHKHLHTGDQFITN